MRILSLIIFLSSQFLWMPETAWSFNIFSQIEKPHKKEIFILDFKNVPRLPKNFRSTWNDIARIPSSVSTVGLENLDIAGGHQFSELELDTILKENPNIKVDVDLRQETHFFVDGIAVTLFSEKDWGNKGLTDAQVIKNEEKLFEILRQQPQFTFLEVYDKDPKNTKKFKTTPLTFEHPLILSEENLTKSKGLFYIRLFITDDMIPSSHEIDRFITFVQTLPPHTGVYFHCRDGHGRTTTFMALYDMIRNAKKVSFEDILMRQFYLGGRDLLKISKPGYLGALQKQRITFLRQFYDYAKNNTDSFYTSWSTYLKTQY